MINKVLIFSHRSDNDGITPIILSKLVFKEVEYILEEPTTINDSFNKSYEDGIFDKYDFIFVTDLCINHELAKKIEEDENIKNKILIFDHHHSRLDMNKYSFISVVDEQDNKKECASSLYFKYLLDNHNNEILTKPVVKEMVELVRLLDTWTWHECNIVEAKWIGNLFDIYGKEYYINYYYQYCLKNEYFEFTEKQKYLLEVEEVRIENYIKKKEKEIYGAKIQGYHVGIVFAEIYRSELGNVLAEKYQDIYDFMIIINISRSSSYRGIKDIDLGAFASQYGGGGHKKASGSPLPENLLDEIVKIIFNDVKLDKV